MRLQRHPDHGLLGGVCAGLAEHLGVPVAPVRATFVVVALAGGIGVVAYLMLWILAPAATSDPAASDPEGESAHRPLWPVLALGGVVAVVLVPIAGLGTALPLLCAGLGAVLVWWHLDQPAGRSGASALRLGLGIALLVLGAVTFIGGQVGSASLVAAVGTAAVVLGGAALVASPFVARLVRDRDRERAERIAIRQRAEIAAHLHDSVLQTLSLIQREHADPDEVLRLARAEERGLRSWLYGQPTASDHGGGLAEQLQQAAGSVERSEAAVIEVVTVGDCAQRSPATDAVVAAAREAMLNAARHAGDAEPVRVFARIDPTDITVFVRDRGVGFDLDGLPPDRGGVRESIVGRIARTGGTTTIRTAPGAGTEVQIRMPR